MTWIHLQQKQQVSQTRYTEHIEQGNPPEVTIVVLKHKINESVRQVGRGSFMIDLRRVANFHIRFYNHCTKHAMIVV